MKSRRIIHFCIGSLVLLALPACTHSAPERFIHPVVLERVDGSVLTGIRNTPDGSFHLWNYDISSGKFDVLASVEYGGKYPNFIPGITSTRLVWNNSNHDEEGLVTGFETLTLDTARKEPVVMDFIQHPTGDDEASVFMTALALVDSGGYMLVHEVDDDGPSRYRVWDLSTESNSVSIPVKEGYTATRAAPAMGIGKGHFVVAEMGYGKEQNGRYQFLLVDAISMREIGSLAVSDVEPLGFFDDPASKCIFVIVRSTCCHDLGYIRLSGEDWSGDRKIDSEDISWLPKGAHSVQFTGDAQFWVTDDKQSETFVLNVKSHAGTGTQDASVLRGKAVDLNGWFNYVVSDDASIVATTFGGDTFEIRNIALPDVTLAKTCRIEARQKADGGYELNLVEE